MTRDWFSLSWETNNPNNRRVNSDFVIHIKLPTAQCPSRQSSVQKNENILGKDTIIYVATPWELAKELLSWSERTCLISLRLPEKRSHRKASGFGKYSLRGGSKSRSRDDEEHKELWADAMERSRELWSCADRCMNWNFVPPQLYTAYERRREKKQHSPVIIKEPV